MFDKKIFIDFSYGLATLLWIIIQIDGNYSIFMSLNARRKEWNFQTTRGTSVRTYRNRLPKSCGIPRINYCWQPVSRACGCWVIRQCNRLLATNSLNWVCSLSSSFIKRLKFSHSCAASLCLAIQFLYGWANGWARYEGITVLGKWQVAPALNQVSRTGTPTHLTETNCTLSAQ